MSLNISFKEFKELSQNFNVIPVYKEIVLDIDTPLSVFLKTKSSDRFSFLFESVEKGENKGRYSFIGSSKAVYIKTKGNYTIKYNLGKTKIIKHDKPLDEIKNIVKKFKPAKFDDLPPFWGGLVGYIGYDVIKFYEPIPDENPDILELPDVFLFLSDEVIVFDNLNNKIKIIVSAILDETKNLEEEYKKSVERIEFIENKLSKDYSLKRIQPKKLQSISLEKWKSNFTKEEFLKAVQKAKKYIKEGDIIQVVLSQRFSKRLEADPIDIYRAVRVINPSPYLFYLDLQDIKLIGSSPEILVSVKNGKIFTKPIAGTRPRGKTKEEDEVLKQNLLSDEKEKAEHLMLVDLARNDVGKVAKPQTVKVDNFMYVENYSHVMHIVSDVSGEIRDDISALDVLISVFPVGTVSGAPKVRAMQIIEELEPDKRGIYAGAVGYISFDGNLDTAIAIRTAIIEGENIHIQAGAGIVADSVPEKEYEETVNKAKALIKAVEIAENC